ncbi:MAG: cation transporter [Cyclobacteriaceae bacterium]
MSHHHHHHSHGTGKIKVAFFINLGFAVIELIGGIYTNSVAIMSDALHDLGDSISLGVSWYFQKISNKDRDRNFSYGYGRFSVLGALINSIILIAGSILILSEAIHRILDPQSPDATGMIYFAIGGIFANGFAAWKLHGGDSLNEKAVYLHLLEDVLGWTATLVGGIVIYYFDWPIIDPILAVAISIFIIYNVFKNLREVLKIFLQGTPPKIDPQKIERLLTNLPRVKTTHDCHLWTMDGSFHILSIHLVVAPYQRIEELSEIKQEAKALLHQEGIDHVTIEFETTEEDCSPC